MTIELNAAAYAAGTAFQAEKRAIFGTAWLPLALGAQIPAAGDYVSHGVGGWPLFALRGSDGAVRAFRNACRHQNMLVLDQPAGRCSELRCRFHGWTYDLKGRFVHAPAAVAPPDPCAADNDLREVAVAIERGVVLCALAPETPASLGEVGDALDEELRLAGTATVEIGCNWKTYLELALARDDDAAWMWPLLLARRHGDGVLVEQVIPRTFLRTRVVRSLLAAGTTTAAVPAADALARDCEALQAERVAGVIAAPSGRVAQLHALLRAAYASHAEARPPE